MKENIASNLPQNIISETISEFNKKNYINIIDKSKRLLKNYPNSLFIWNILGASYAILKKLEEAEKCFKKTIEIDKKFIDGYYNLGKTLKELNKYSDAISSYKKVIELKPNHVAAYNNMANILKKIGQHENAILNYKKAIELKPDYIEAYFNLGNTQKEYGKHPEAIKNYKKAIELKPSYAEAYNELGGAQIEIGNHTKAIANYKKAIELKPDYVECYNNYTNAVYIKYDDYILDKLQKLILKNNLSEKDKIYSSFAMGKSQLDIGKIDLGFKFLNIGNKLRKKQLNYNIKKLENLFLNIKKYFKEDLLNEKIIEPEVYTKPIFILGMPRSGTTLVEQILSSHPSIYGGGELEFLRNIIFSLNWEYSKNKQEDIIKIRKEYLKNLKNISQASLITDKTPLNFHWIGFIINAFPGAKIIHLKRDPVAVCWSNYKINFPTEGMSYSFDQEDVAKYYKLYEDLMKFWHEKYPNIIYDLNYEYLTENQNLEIKKLLKYLDLAWDPNVLNFYENKRPVRTASNLQVRKQIYTGSSKNWVKYEKWLKPMINYLNK